MITLKLTSYNPNECSTLARVLRDTATALCNEAGNASKCNLCPSRKICNDLVKAADFAERTAYQTTPRG